MKKVLLVLSVAAFSILAAFCGVGVAWVVIATVANHMSKDRGDGFVAGSVPILVAGAVAGFIVGLVGRIIWLRRKHDAYQSASANGASPRR